MTSSDRGICCNHDTVRFAFPSTLSNVKDYDLGMLMFSYSCASVPEVRCLIFSTGEAGGTFWGYQRPSPQGLSHTLSTERAEGRQAAALTPWRKW